MERQMSKRMMKWGWVAASLVMLTACGGKTEAVYPEDPEDVRRERHGKMTGEGGLQLFGPSDDSASGKGGTGIGVNSFLWRAALDTFSFMPLASADPFGGVIITDWYEDPKTPGERFKANVVILDRTLRSDGVKVSLFRQQKDKQGVWRDVEASASTARQLEDTILTRARELRVKQLGS